MSCDQIATGHYGTLPADRRVRAMRCLPGRAGVGLDPCALRINHVSLASFEAHPIATPLTGVDASGLPR